MKDGDEKPATIMETYFKLEESERLIVLWVAAIGAGVTLVCLLNLLLRSTPPWWAG